MKIMYKKRRVHHVLSRTHSASVFDHMPPAYGTALSN